MEVSSLSLHKECSDSVSHTGRKYIANFYERLIPLVEKKPSLWDKKHPKYMSCGVSRVIWTQIAKNFNMSGSDVRKRWKNVRDTYRKELLKINAQQMVDPYATSRWKHFEALDFLRSQFITVEDSSAREEFDNEDILTPTVVMGTGSESHDIENDVNNFIGNNDMEYFEVTTIDSGSPRSIHNYEPGTVVSETGEVIEGQLPNYNEASPEKNSYRNSYYENPQKYQYPWKENRKSSMQDTRIRHILMKVQELENRLTNSLQYPNTYLKSPSEMGNGLDQSNQCDGGDYHFLLSLLPTLRSLPRERKIVVRSKIMQIVRDEYKFLKED